MFERSSYVGGRSVTVEPFDDPSQPLEVGASIFVKVNKNLYNAANELSLDMKDADSDRPKEAPQAFGVWDGTAFKYTQAQSSPWIFDVIKMLLQYGLSPLKTKRLVSRTVNNFLKFYDEPLFPFTSLENTVDVAGLSHVVSSFGGAFLEENGVFPPFSTDIIQVLSPQCSDTNQQPF